MEDFQNDFDPITRKINSFHKNIWVYTVSPVKTWTMILDIIKNLYSKYREIEYIAKDVVFYYSSFISMVLDETESIRHVYMILIEKSLNK